MKIYMLKTGYNCCGDCDETLGVFTDLEKLRPAILRVAEAMWGKCHVPQYHPCGGKWGALNPKPECDHDCKNCSSFCSEKEYLKELYQKRDELLKPSNNIYVVVWEADAAVRSSDEEFWEDFDQPEDTPESRSEYERRNAREREIRTSYALRPSNSSIGRIPLISELYGEEIYRFEMPANLQAAIDQLEGKLTEE